MFMEKSRGENMESSVLGIIALFNSTNKSSQKFCQRKYIKNLKRKKKRKIQNNNTQSRIKKRINKKEKGKINNKTIKNQGKKELRNREKNKKSRKSQNKRKVKKPKQSPKLKKRKNNKMIFLVTTLQLSQLKK